MKSYAYLAEFLQQRGFGQYVARFQRMLIRDFEGKSFPDFQSITKLQDVVVAADVLDQIREHLDELRKRLPS